MAISVSHVEYACIMAVMCNDQRVILKLCVGDEKSTLGISMPASQSEASRWVSVLASRRQGKLSHCLDYVYRANESS